MATTTQAVTVSKTHTPFSKTKNDEKRLKIAGKLSHQQYCSVFSINN
jgi:hypothetical protein